MIFIVNDASAISTLDILLCQYFRITNHISFKLPSTNMSTISTVLTRSTDGRRGNSN